MLILALDTSAAACSACLGEVDLGTLGEGLSAKAPSPRPQAQWRGHARLLSERLEPMAKGHAEALPPMVAQVLAEAGVTPADLGGLAVSLGPGTFTGVRIALAAAKGLCAVHPVPVLGTSTLHVMAWRFAAIPAGRIKNEFGQAPHGLAEPPHLGVVVDARRDQLYVQMFTPEAAPLGDAEIISHGDVGTWLAVHPGLPTPCSVALLGSGAQLVDCAPVTHPGSPRMFRVHDAAELLPSAGALFEMAAAQTLSHHGFPGVRWDEVTPIYLRAPDAKPQTPLLASRAPRHPSEAAGGRTRLD